jgi:hypothetical protein
VTPSASLSIFRLSLWLLCSFPLAPDNPILYFRIALIVLRFARRPFSKTRCFSLLVRAVLYLPLSPPRIATQPHPRNKKKKQKKKQKQKQKQKQKTFADSRYCCVGPNNNTPELRLTFKPYNFDIFIYRDHGNNACKADEILLKLLKATGTL